MGDERASERENGSKMLEEPLCLPEDEEACVIKWKISKSHKGAHILRKLFSQFIKEIVEGMIGYVHLPTIMSKLLSDNGTQEFGDFKLTILGMLGTYSFERRILVCAQNLDCALSMGSVLWINVLGIFVNKLIDAALRALYLNTHNYRLNRFLIWTYAIQV